MQSDPLKRRVAACFAHFRYGAAMLGALACCAVTGQPLPPSVAPSAAAQVQRPANIMAEAGRALGVQRCLPALSRLASLALTGSVAHDVVVDWDKQAPDTSPFFGLMGVTVAQTGTHATTFVVSPDSSGTCTVLAERLAWAPKPCIQLAREELPGYAVTPLLQGMLVLTHPSDTGSTISLMEAGPGCNVLRRFVQYRWRDPSGSAAPSTSSTPLSIPPKR